MAITAADVNKLRQQTGAGMMDCKKALVEADGDFEVATDILRKKGQKVASKRGDNETSEGLIFAESTADGKAGVIMMLNCETDFVARNDEFVKFVKSIVSIALDKKPNTVEELLALPYDAKLSIADKLTEQIGVIGEKLVISKYATINSDTVVAYNHPGNQLAALVGLNKSSEAVKEAGHQVAMQVAAMAPIAVDKSGVDAHTIEREIEVGKELAIQEGKPADMAEKIAQGRLTKFFKENTLLPQPFVRDHKVTVEEFLHQTDNGLTVTKFERFSMN